MFLNSTKGGRYKWSVIQPLHLGDGQGKKQTFEYQWYPYPLLQAHLDRCDADTHRIEICSVTEHHVYSGNWN